MNKIRTRTHEVFNTETFEAEFIVDVNIGTGWAWLVSDGGICRFATKKDAADARKNVVANYKKLKAQEKTDD